MGHNILYFSSQSQQQDSAQISTGKKWTECCLPSAINFLYHGQKTGMWGKLTVPVFLISPSSQIVPASFPRSSYYWMEAVDKDGPVAEDVESTKKLRSALSTATAFLIIFHKSQSQCSAWLSRTGTTATPELQHRVLHKPRSLDMLRQPPQA